MSQRKPNPPPVPPGQPVLQHIGTITIKCLVLCAPNGQPMQNTCQIHGDTFTPDVQGMVAMHKYLNMAAEQAFDEAINKAVEKVDAGPKILRASSLPN